MHIPDGFVPPSVAIAGYAITGGVTWYSLRQINRERFAPCSRDRNPQEKIPKASLLTAAFFVASLIHIPIPPTSIHFVLNGILGAILGYYAFPAIIIGLFFQAALFQHGGLSTLGINAVVMGIPALLAYHLFQLRDRFPTQQQKRWTKILAFGAGAGALGLSAIIFTVVIITNLSPDINAQTERNAIYLSLIGYGIQAVLEGIFTVMLISFIEKVKPELLK